MVFYDAFEGEFRPAVDNRSTAVLRTSSRGRDDLDAARVRYVTQHWLVLSNRRFGTAYRSQPQGSRRRRDVPEGLRRRLHLGR